MIIVGKTLNLNSIIIKDDAVLGSDSIYVYRPNWLEKLRGITWEDKVRIAKADLLEREAIIMKTNNNKEE